MEAMLEICPDFCLTGFGTDSQTCSNESISPRTTTSDGARDSDQLIQPREEGRNDADRFGITEAAVWEMSHDPLSTAPFQLDEDLEMFGPLEPLFPNSAGIGQEWNSPMALDRWDGSTLAPPPTPQDGLVIQSDGIAPEPPAVATRSHVCQPDQAASDGFADLGEVAKRLDDGQNQRRRCSKAASGSVDDGSSPVARCAERTEGRDMEVHRAKNRVAAQKSRAHRKSENEALERQYEERAAKNRHLKQQERELRDMLTSLRDSTLQHDPTRCRCRSLHEFNKRQAANVVRGSASSVLG